MKTKWILGFFIILFLSVASQSQSADYYMAPYGDDSSDGSIEQPWRSLHVSINRLTPGDTLYLRGGRYSGLDQVTAEIRVIGTAGHPITIRNYPGETPVLSGTKVIDSGWVDDGNGVYKRVLTDDGFSQGENFYPRIVIQNLKGQTGGEFMDVWPDPVSSRQEVNAPGLWYADHASHTLYIFPQDLGAGNNANDYTIEIGDLPVSIADRDAIPTLAGYLHIEGLTFYGFTGTSSDPGAVRTKGALYFPRPAMNIQREYLSFKNLTFKNCWTGITVIGFRHMTISDSTFDNCIDNGIIGSSYSFSPTDDSLIENCTFIDLHAPWPPYSNLEQADAAIKVHFLNGMIIRGNLVENVIPNRAEDEFSSGIWIDTDATNAIIERNTILDVWGGHGIIVEQRSDNITVQRNTVVGARTGISIGTKEQIPTDWSENTKVYHNTIVGNRKTGLYLNAAIKPDIRNNIFINNGNSQIMITRETLADTRNAGGGILIDYNDCWSDSPPGPNLFYRLDGGLESNANADDLFVQSIESVSGLDHEIHSDPLFVDSINMDFKLSAGSLCIDSGDDLGWPCLGAAPDLGRYETFSNYYPHYPLMHRWIKKQYPLQVLLLGAHYREAVQTRLNGLSMPKTKNLHRQ